MLINSVSDRVGAPDLAILSSGTWSDLDVFLSLLETHVLEINGSPHSTTDWRTKLDSNQPNTCPFMSDIRGSVFYTQLPISIMKQAMEGQLKFIVRDYLSASSGMATCHSTHLSSR